MLRVYNGEIFSDPIHVVPIARVLRSLGKKGDLGLMGSAIFRKDEHLHFFSFRHVRYLESKNMILGNSQRLM